MWKPHKSVVTESSYAPVSDDGSQDGQTRGNAQPPTSEPGDHHIGLHGVQTPEHVPRFPRRSSSARPRSRIETRVYRDATTGSPGAPGSECSFTRESTSSRTKQQPASRSRRANRPASTLGLISRQNVDGDDSASPVSITPFDTQAVFAPVSSGSEEEPRRSGGKTHRTVKKEKEKEELVVQAIKEKYSKRPSRPASSLRALPPPPPLFDFSSVQEEEDPDQPAVLKGIPKTGTGQPMIWPCPFHVYYVRPQAADFFKGPPHLAQRMALHDRIRLQNPQDVTNALVYDCIDPSPMHASLPIGPLPPGQLRPYYIVQDDADNCLVFESRFESGNLRRAIRVYEYEYDLILKPDTNTRGHTQWYYFKVSNTRRNRNYKFNIINMMKPDSLYNYGMQPLMYSEHASKTKGIGWFRGGTDVCYYQNHIKRGKGYYQTLTFNVTFDTDYDTVYFAYCYPYTYTDLVEYLKSLEADPKRANRFRRRALCQTLAGNTCDLLTVTSFTGDPEALRHRKGIVISARVHPGESNASWMMKGFIDYLTGSSMDAKILRDNFVFKIVPMLNPDGVIVGNYRCSLAGVDLNRQWIEPSKKLHPTISNLKTMIKAFSEDREVILYCDLHGHSRKQNIFMYGCEAKPGMNDGFRLRERIFPRLLSHNGEFFSYPDCNFKVQKAKEATARVVVNRELGIINSYTMEASFCGANFGPLSGKHFDSTHFEKIGHYFCDTILDFCDPDQSKVQQACRELEDIHPSRIGGGSEALDSYAINTMEMDLERDSAGSDDDSSFGSTPARPKGVSGKKKKDRKGKKDKKGKKDASEKKRRVVSKGEDSGTPGGTVARVRSAGVKRTSTATRYRVPRASSALSGKAKAKVKKTKSTKAKASSPIDELQQIAAGMGYGLQDQDWELDSIIEPQGSDSNVTQETTGGIRAKNFTPSKGKGEVQLKTVSSSTSAVSLSSQFSSKSKTEIPKQSRGTRSDINAAMDHKYGTEVVSAPLGHERSVSPSPPHIEVAASPLPTRPPRSLSASRSGLPGRSRVASTATPKAAMREILALEVLEALTNDDIPDKKPRPASGSAVNATRQARNRVKSAKTQRHSSIDRSSISSSVLSRTEVEVPTVSRPQSSLGIRGKKRQTSAMKRRALPPGRRAGSHMDMSDLL